MKFNTLPISSVSLITLCTVVASASAWSCGPSPRVIGNRYSVGCRPNEICGPSSTDFLTMPEIQAMLRRSRNKQRYFYRPFLEEFRTSMGIPFGTTTFPPWKTRSNKPSTPTSVSPRYDIIESDRNIQLAIDVPGVEMENISILLDDQAKVLTVSGSRAQSTSARFGTNERDDSSELPTSARTFSQKFVLKNPTIDINHISASLENGVLTITLPKIPPEEKVKDSNVRQIPIMSTKSASSTTTTDDTIGVDDGNDPLVADTESHESESVVAMSEEVDDQLPDSKSDQSKNSDPPDTYGSIGKDNK